MKMGMHMKGEAAGYKDKGLEFKSVLDAQRYLYVPADDGEVAPRNATSDALAVVLAGEDALETPDFHLEFLGDETIGTKEIPTPLSAQEVDVLREATVEFTDSLASIDPADIAADEVVESERGSARLESNQQSSFQMEFATDVQIDMEYVENDAAVDAALDAGYEQQYSKAA